MPYIPVPNLILEHCENLLKSGIKGLMASWTEGGYPSPNFDVAKECYFSPTPELNRILSDVAARHYGRAAAPEILEAWRIFSRAFLEYPMEGGGIVYHIPTQHGPTNLLRLHPTGYKATMMLFPYDDYQAWVGSYPVEVVEKQFRKMAALWESGLEEFRRALKQVPASKQPSARKDLGIAETCYLHFKSVANQILFYRLRASYQESAIAFEASNHYYYRPLDLVEKVLNCHDIINALHTGVGS